MMGGIRTCDVCADRISKWGVQTVEIDGIEQSVIKAHKIKYANNYKHRFCSDECLIKYVEINDIGTHVTVMYRPEYYDQSSLKTVKEYSWEPKKIAAVLDRDLVHQQVTESE